LFRYRFWRPQKITHPVQIVGYFINKLEFACFLKNRKDWGVIANLFVLIGVFIISIFLANIHWAIEVYLLYTCLATRSLSDETLKIKRVLEKNDIALARQEIGYLVSRDTGQMDQNKITRSTIETVAENTVDGVTAPLF